MGQLSAPWPMHKPQRRPWPRSRRRGWNRPNGLLPPAAAFALIPSLPRCELARLTEQLIDRMDEIDGDLDVELNGDELDGHFGEDEFYDRDDGSGLPGDPDDAEEGHDAEQEENHA